MRDLCRARDETIRALQAVQCQRKAFLLRHDIRSTGRATWRPAHLRWLSEVVCPTPAQQIGCQAYIRAVTDHTERLARLEQARTDQVQTWRLAPVVDALQALRGGPCTVAVTTVAERGDRTQFAHPRPLRHSLGFTPSADSTGERRQQGGITTTGNSHARRALVAGAWPLAPPPKSAGLCHDAWRRCPRRAKRAVGRRRYDAANATDRSAPEGKMPTRWLSPSRGNSGRFCGPWPRRSR